MSIRTILGTRTERSKSHPNPLSSYLRNQTEEIKDIILRLERKEESLKNANTKFNTVVFMKFYEKSSIWNQYINCLSTLDCLANLSIVSAQSDFTMTKLIFIPISQNNNIPLLELREMVHPCIASKVKSFVANDTYIGVKNNDNNNKTTQKTAVVITGANMGGKSTILRQTCIAVIMAQIGCYIPAEYCRMTITDRIFTRMGARDK